MNDYGALRAAVDDGIASVTFDHPPTNLVDGAVIGALAALVDDLERDASVRVAVFRSADADFFLMHGDVEQLVAVPAHPFQPATEPNIAVQTFERLHGAPYFTIGVVDGAARGGGCELLSALDYRIGSPRAVIGQPEVAMGILPGAGGTVRWPRFAGRADALELILTGRDLDADEALAVGWLQRLVRDEDLVEAVDQLARRVAVMPRDGIAAVKRVVDASLDRRDDAWLIETNALGALMAAGAHVDPMRRFLAAGGQTREGETMRMASVMDAMLNRDQ